MPDILHFRSAVSGSFTGSLLGSSSYSTTASYALTSAGSVTNASTASLALSLSGSLIGSGTLTGSVTGNILGSASYATTSSYAATVPYSGVLNTPVGIVSSSAQINTGSFVGTFIGSASYADMSLTSSYSLYAVTASYFSGTTDFPNGLTGSFTGSFTGSLLGSASYATTASYALTSAGTVTNASTASLALSLSGSIIGSGTLTGSVTGNILGSASYATTSSYAVTTNFDNILNKPALVSSSTQINTGSFTGSFTGNLFGTSSIAASSSYILGVKTSGRVIPYERVTLGTILNTGSWYTIAEISGTNADARGAGWIIITATGNDKTPFSDVYYISNTWNTTGSVLSLIQKNNVETVYSRIRLVRESGSLVQTNIHRHRVDIYISNSFTNIGNVAISSSGLSVTTYNDDLMAPLLRPIAFVSASSSIQVWENIAVDLPLIRTIGNQKYGIISTIAGGYSNVTSSIQEIADGYVGIGKQLIFLHDNSYDIGSESAWRPRNIFAGNTITANRFTGSFTGSLLGSSSYSTTASYALTSAGTATNASTASLALALSGSIIGSGTLTGSVTGNLLGSASYATTSSYAVTSNFNNILDKPTLVSSSAQINTGSFTGSFTGGLLGTASYAINSTNSYTSSLALSLSGSIIGSGTLTGSVTGNLLGTASYANIAATASYFTGSIDFPTGLTVTGSVTASAFTGSFTGSLLGSASYATTASYALTSAGTVTNASTASLALSLSGSIIGSGTLTGSVTGNLLGSSSYATTASYSVETLFNNILNKPTLVSSSAQINTGSFTGTFVGNINANVVSASSGIYATASGNTTSSIVARGKLEVVQSADGTPGDYKFTINPEGTGPRLQLGTIPVPNIYFEIGAYQSVNNFDSKTRDLKLFVENSVFKGMVISASNGRVGINIAKPAYDFDISGTTNISHGAIITGSVTASVGYTGSFTGSLLGSSSYALTSSYAVTAPYAGITGIPSGLVSSSAQINTGSFTGSFTGNLLGTSSFTTRAAALLQGDQVISGTLTISESAAVNPRTPAFSIYVNSSSIFAHGMYIAPSDWSINGESYGSWYGKSINTQLLGVIGYIAQVSDRIISVGFVRPTAAATQFALPNKIEFFITASSTSGSVGTIDPLMYMNWGAAGTEPEFVPIDDFVNLGTASNRWKSIYAVSMTGSILGSSSYSTTASYALTSAGTVTSAATASLALNLSGSIIGSGTLTGSVTGNLLGSASYATTSSYAATTPYAGITGIPSGLVSSSTQINTGSFTGSFTGNLLGSSSYALTSSYAATAPYAGIIGIPSGLVSSSIQVNTGSFTGSFTGGFFGTASLTASAALYISGADGNSGNRLIFGAHGFSYIGLQDETASILSIRAGRPAQAGPDISLSSNSHSVQNQGIITIRAGIPPANIDPSLDGRIDFSTNGTGRWRILLSGGLVPVVDNTVDIGSTSARVRSITAVSLSGSLTGSITGNILGTSSYASALSVRGTTQVTTANISDLETETSSVAIGKSWMLLSVQADRACRVRLYSTTGSRFTDGLRNIGIDPSASAGVLADFVFTAAGTLMSTPIVVGANMEGNVSSSAPYLIQNRSGGASTVTVTFTTIRLE